MATWELQTPAQIYWGAQFVTQIDILEAQILIFALPVQG